MSIGKNIRQIRVDRGYTQAQLADAVNVSEKTVSSWEVDRTEPNIDYLQKISDFLRCPVDSLMGKSKMSPAEHLIISRYRELDEYGKKAVFAILNIEHDRCTK